MIGVFVSIIFLVMGFIEFARGSGIEVSLYFFAISGLFYLGGAVFFKTHYLGAFKNSIIKALEKGIDVRKENKQ